MSNSNVLTVLSVFLLHNSTAHFLQVICVHWHGLWSVIIHVNRTKKIQQWGKKLENLVQSGPNRCYKFPVKAKQTIAINSHTAGHGKWKIYGYTRTRKAYAYYLMPCIMSDALYTGIFVFIKGLSNFCNKSLDIQICITNFSHFICTSEKVKSVYACHNTRCIIP
jgi:hypothetical protein